MRVCVQGQLHSKGKEIDRKVKLTVKDKNRAEERVQSLLRRIEKLKVERDQLSGGLKEHLDLVEQRRVAEAKAKNGLLRQRKKGQSDDEFVSSCLAAIEQRVKDLDHELEQNAGSVGDERRILKEMQRVRATKTQIPLYLQRSKAFQEARAACKRAERDVESKTSFIKTLEDELDNLRAEIAALDNKEEAESAPVKKALSTEEEVLTDQLNKLYADLRAAKDGLNENREKWYEARREKQRKNVEKAQQRREEEYARREAEKKAAAVAARQDKKSVVPYAKEIRDCNSLLAYLDGLAVKTDDKKSADKPKSDAEDKPAADDKHPENANQKGRGPPIAEDDWAAFAKPKKKGGRKNKNKQVKLSINLQSMDQFAKLGFPPPMSLEDVPALREQIAAKQAELQKKSDAERAEILAQIEKEEAEEARIEKEKAAAAAPAPSAGTEETPAAAADDAAAATAE